MAFVSAPEINENGSKPLKKDRPRWGGQVGVAGRGDSPASPRCTRWSRLTSQECARDDGEDYNTKFLVMLNAWDWGSEAPAVTSRWTRCAGMCGVLICSKNKQEPRSC